MLKLNEHQAFILGPREVGGVYYSGYWRCFYLVLAVDLTSQACGACLTCLWEDNTITTHCTAWDACRDEVVCTGYVPEVAA